MGKKNGAQKCTLPHQKSVFSVLKNRTKRVENKTKYIESKTNGRFYSTDKPISTNKVQNFKAICTGTFPSKHNTFITLQYRSTENIYIHAIRENIYTYIRIGELSKKFLYCVLTQQKPATKTGSGMARKHSEKTLEKLLATACHTHGWLCWKFVSPGLVGVPDRIILTPSGRVVFAEIKTSGKKTTPIQTHRHHQLNTLGYPVYLIDQPEHITQLVTTLEEQQ
ncbi:VRR-NUC domain-containing protein [Trueperella sp. LYQ143]|uniref:VRR-NUC domain-containing protein n=1 Tax=unclassified Trueperella TaxID=2630174 RepID=UPI003983CB8E